MADSPELTPGRTWDVMKGVQFQHISYINSKTAYVALYTPTQSYKWRLTQNTWYNYNGWLVLADVQIRNRRVNHIQIVSPEGLRPEPITVRDMSLHLSPEYDVRSEGLYGVTARFMMGGNQYSQGRIRIRWSNIDEEYFASSDIGRCGEYCEIGYSLPKGSHDVCIVVL